MGNALESVLKNRSLPVVLNRELSFLLPGTKNSLHSRVKRALAKEKLIRLRKGLYYIGSSIQGESNKLNPYEIAAYIYAPSCISLESALAYHQLIPEAVYRVTCVTSKRSVIFEIPVGVFSYLHLPLEGFYTEVELVSVNQNHFFLAKPWRALCDYIYCYKKNWINLTPVLESLRIDKMDLPPLPKEKMLELKKFYCSRRIDRFLKGLEKELDNGS